MRQAIFSLILLVSGAVAAAAGTFRFDSIDGGDIDLGAWRGSPVMVVNTASLCGFTPQYEGLQALWEGYRDRGLKVLAVPSNTFRQELEDEAAVKDFCELTFGLDLPMTEITEVRGPNAHPFYRWLAAETGWAPSWNFNKVLLDGQGQVVATWGSATRPTSRAVTSRIEALLD
ncbi:glutathione peroxidase [Rhodobacteraceae bacterium CCMM004]|nr:glutathione peroxidase [Rhodobacteraceae bacterium CCMM004]